ncbi:MAG: Rha family transcriptional regulator [Rubrivivax sp.]|nr:Rha family transcriptional regulator [Rubrivivax sp.]MDP3612436.1 Rha family transcriptional regulator [Rubrivivax sp.]
MELKPDTDLSLFITEDVERKELVTDSRSVALLWKRRHDNVLRDINSMLTSAEPEIREFVALNFEGVTYKGRNGEQRPMYRMTAKAGKTVRNLGRTLYKPYPDLTRQPRAHAC